MTAAITMQFVATIIAAVVGPYLTVRFALGRFSQEKIYERRLNTYLEAIDAIHVLVRLYTFWIKCEIEHRKISDDKGSRDNLSYENALNAIRRVRDIGDLLLSQEAAEILKVHCIEVEKDCPRDVYIVDFYEKKLDQSELALRELRAVAKADLGTAPSSKWLKWLYPN